MSLKRIAHGLHDVRLRKEARAKIAAEVAAARGRPCTQLPDPNMLECRAPHYVGLRGAWHGCAYQPKQEK